MNKSVSLLFLLFFLFSCSSKKSEYIDFEQIKESGELTIITVNSSTSYFIYKDEPMGYDYELAKDFCDFYGLKLNVKVAENSTKLIEMLENGEGDLVAYDVPVQTDLKNSVIYCGLEQISHQVLVQRIENKDSMVTDVPQLIEKEIYVKDNTKYHQRLVNQNAELGSGIIIKDVLMDTVTVDDLIRMVSLGEIDYTVADEYIAKLNKTYFHNIDISEPLSFEQRSSWVVRKTSPMLAKALDEWFQQNDKTPVYKSVTKKYFELSKMSFDDSDSTVFIIPHGAVSPFDDVFKKYAKTSGYDWELLAAIAYQESRFKTNLSSWAGAVGLMGLMPRTAKSLGVSGDELKNPELSIKAGAGLIKRLDKMFSKIENREQRIKFVLASYNAGNGHIADAQALARKYGDNPYVWDGSVEKYVELKSKPEYYNDPVCKSGYLRSKEVLNYVSQVSKNWNKYKNQNRD